MSDEQKKEETALVSASEAGLRLVALDPVQLQRSQSFLIEWSNKKIVAVQEEVDAFQQNLDIATKAKWNTSRPKAHLRLARQRLVFYEKLRDALESGYYIVPDMPCDIFAIRTERSVPKRQLAESQYPHDWGLIKDEQSQLLPSSEGEYANPEQSVRRSGPSKYIEDGKEKESYVFRNRDEYQDIVFPFTLAKPIVLAATQRAMALKIFDEIGVCPASPKKDPMVLGIIKQPRRGYRQRQLTFLIAWFLDTEML